MKELFLAPFHSLWLSGAIWSHRSESKFVTVTKVPDDTKPLPKANFANHQRGLVA